MIVGVGVTGVIKKGASAEEQSSSPDNVTSGDQTPAEVSQNSSTGSSTSVATSGIGIASSALVNLITDKTLAYVNTLGTVSATVLDLSATNNQTEEVGSGAIAIAVAGEQDSGVTDIAGAFALNQISDDTQAFVKGATLTVTDTTPVLPTLSLTVLREGTLATFTAALSADTTANGKDFAGSVSVNRILDTTGAVLDSVTVTQAKAVDLDAENNATMIAIGGGASFTKGGVGIGASIGFNQISAQTEAGVLGTDRRESLTVGSLTATAKNDDTIDAVGVSAGVAVGDSGSVAGAFTLGIDVIGSSSPSIFLSTPGIVATIQNADVIASGAVALTADDNSIIQSIAGAIGMGPKASGFGLGLSWNEVTVNVDVTVDDATVTAASVSLTSEATQDAGLLHGKISSASVGAAVSESGSAAVGAGISVDGVQNTIDAQVINGAAVTANTGDISVTASDMATIYTLVGGAAIAANDAGADAAISGNHIANTVDADITGATATSTLGNVSIAATEGPRSTASPWLWALETMPASPRRSRLA